MANLHFILDEISKVFEVHISLNNLSSPVMWINHLRLPRFILRTSPCYYSSGINRNISCWISQGWRSIYSRLRYLCIRYLEFGESQDCWWLFCISHQKVLFIFVNSGGLNLPSNTSNKILPDFYGIPILFSKRINLRHYSFLLFQRKPFFNNGENVGH